MCGLPDAELHAASAFEQCSLCMPSWLGCCVWFCVQQPWAFPTQLHGHAMFIMQRVDHAVLMSEHACVSAVCPVLQGEAGRDRGSIQCC